MFWLVNFEFYIDFDTLITVSLVIFCNEQELMNKHKNSKGMPLQSCLDDPETEYS